MTTGRDAAESTAGLTRRALGWRVAKVALLTVVLVGVYRVMAGSLTEQGVGAAELLRWPVHGGRLAASLTLLVSVYLAHAALWRLIMRDLEVARPGFPITVRVYFLASLGRYIPGRLWQLAGLAILAQRAGMPAAAAAAAAVIGQLAFLGTGLAFLAVTLPGWGGGYVAWAAAALVAALALAGLLLVSPAGRALRQRAGPRLGGSRSGRQLALALKLVDHARPRHIARWGIAYLATWVALGAAFALFASAFAPEAAGQFRHLGGTVAAAYLAGYVAIFAPGGIVVREGAMTLLLNEIMPMPAAIVVAVASRLWFTAAELLPLAALPILPATNARTP
jgi:glycosyltransferase 2 family protein